jgi:hypothetical protein
VAPVNRDAVAAVDLWAPNGQVILGYLGHDAIRLAGVARFDSAWV